MSKIFCYELRRMLWNKGFIGILAVLLFYGWQVLTGPVIRGVAHTAPFSPWSFGYYLSQVLPLICLGELFFLTFFTSGRELRMKAVTDATPADKRQYAMVRCKAALVGTGLIILCVILLAAGFYAELFGPIPFAGLMAPALLTLAPPVLFCLGVGWSLGQIRPVFAYAVMAVPFILACIPMPQAIDFSMSRFYMEYPTMLKIADPVFTAPAAILCGRFCYLAAGAAALLYGLRRCR